MVKPVWNYRKLEYLYMHLIKLIMDKRNPLFGMVLHLSDIYDLDDSTYENE